MTRIYRVKSVPKWYYDIVMKKFAKKGKVEIKDPYYYLVKGEKVYGSFIMLNGEFWDNSTQLSYKDNLKSYGFKDRSLVRVMK